MGSRVNDRCVSRGCLTANRPLIFGARSVCYAPGVQSRLSPQRKLAHDAQPVKEA
jgi:hypothetical protein